MGQYYRTLRKQPNGRIVVYNRDVIRDGKPEYMVNYSRLYIIQHSSPENHIPTFCAGMWF